jgi:cobalt-zinc-cadmium efflux system protein
MQHPHDYATPLVVPLRPAAWAFAISLIFFFIELAGGIRAGSLALIADALHMACDVVALGVTLAAAFFSTWRPDTKRTFGYKRLEVIAALGNGLWLWVVAGILLHEGYERILSPTPVSGSLMLAVACVGLIANLSSATILYASSRKNINVRGSFLHVATDAVGSFGAMLAAVVIMKTHWYRADAVASIFICILIIGVSFWLLRDSVHILLEGAPSHIDLEDIRRTLSAMPGVKEVHDLHLWSLTQGSETMSGHLVVEEKCDSHAILNGGRKLLEERFGLTHVTLQIEK